MWNSPQFLPQETKPRVCLVTNDPYKYQNGQLTPILQIPRWAGNSHLQLHSTTTAAGDAGEDDSNEDVKGENDARMAVLVLLTMASLGEPIKVLVSYFLRTLQLLLLPFPPLLPQQPFYHWRELPQVSFLSRQKFCWDKHTFVVTKDVFCCNGSMLVTKKTFETNKIMFVATNICHGKSFATTNMCLSWQKFFCYDKTFVATTIFF